MRPLDLVRMGALLALLAGVAWMASGLVALATAGGGEPDDPGAIFLSEALHAVALAGTLGGIVALHVRQTLGYGLLGKAGFVAAFSGTGLLLTGLLLGSATGYGPGTALLDPALALALWTTLSGFALLGVATLRLGALPGRCGWALVACVPLAIAFGDYGGGVVLGLTWLVLGHALLSQHDVSALLRAKRG